jgi:hypothetical protein
VLLVGFDGCEVRLCGLCAFVRPRVPCVSCVSRLPPVSFYRYRVSRVSGPARRLIEYGCDNRGSRGPRASVNRIRMYAGPVSWVSILNIGCESRGLPPVSFYRYCTHGAAVVSKSRPT